jgi:hypothetical protein
MTVPNGAKPDTGWTAIIFNHGYVRPSEYSTTDEMVPVAWSETLVEELQAVGNSSYEFYAYPDDSHNIVVNYGVAMRRTVDFFDTYVKGQ